MPWIGGGGCQGDGAAAADFVHAQQQEPSSLKASGGLVLLHFPSRYRGCRRLADCLA
jgi:hypothetical protein